MTCGVRPARARRVVVALVAAALLLTARGAQAQFACAGTIGASDVSCGNTGTTAVPFVLDQTGAFNLTTTSSGASSGIATSSVDGNVIATNAGADASVLVTVANGLGNATSVNSGSINGFMETVAVGGGNATTVNSGVVNIGIETLTINGGNATTVNTGVVYGQVVTASGVTSGSGNATLTNAGRIYGEADVGVFTSGIATLTNSGLIDAGSPSNVAINLTTDPTDPASHSTLNILPGSRIIGQIGLAGAAAFPGSGTTVNIYGGRDVSSVLTFGLGCGCGGGLTDTGATVNVLGGAPYVINGNTVAILDPSSFAVADRNVLDVTRAISSLVTGRLTNPAPLGGEGAAAIGFAPSGNVARDMANDAFAGIPALAYARSDRVLLSNPSVTAADGTSVWAQGFGGRRIQPADTPILRSVNDFAGGALGVDRMVRPGLRLGAFLGAGTVKSTLDLNAGDTSSDLVFGGIYGRYALGNAFLDASLLGGGSGNDVRRTMASNLAPGGLETATGSYHGWFISPELAYGVRQALGGQFTLTPSARLRYLAAGFGGYQESGSTANLTVGSRVSHNFEERGEVMLTQTLPATANGRLQLNGTLGVLALQRLGDSTVNTILLGQSLAFATPGKNAVAGFYTGAGFDWRTATGVALFGAIEFTAMSDSSQTLTGRGGARVAF